MCEYSIIIKCENYERFKEIMENMESIARKREDKKKNDKRSGLMKTLHHRTKLFHEQNSRRPDKRGEGTPRYNGNDY